MICNNIKTLHILNIHIHKVLLGYCYHIHTTITSYSFVSYLYLCKTITTYLYLHKSILHFLSVVHFSLYQNTFQIIWRCIDFLSETICNLFFYIHFAHLLQQLRNIKGTIFLASSPIFLSLASTQSYPADPPLLMPSPSVIPSQLFVF